MDDAVFALHLVAALTLWAAGIIWVGTAWKPAWGTAAATPRNVPSLVFLLFLPSAVVGLTYICAAVHRVYRGRWWMTALRALVIMTAGTAAVMGVISRAH